ncbi:MAG: hypothetical protein V8Q54_06985 [Alistipes senegalensis]
MIPARVGAYSETGKLPEYEQFKALMITAGLDNSGGLVTPIADGLVFFPTNEAVIAAKAAGNDPRGGRWRRDGAAEISPVLFRAAEEKQA